MILYVTYCSAKKTKGFFTPDILYKSNRIKRFINRCREVGVNWAILSAKYGFVFPDQQINDYNVTMKSNNRYWLGIAVVKDEKKLSVKESSDHIEELSRTLLQQSSQKRIDKIIFYAPTPKRAKCYLAVLHYAFDKCSEYHNKDELISHLAKSEKVKVIRSLNEIP